MLSASTGILAHQDLRLPPCQTGGLGVIKRETIVASRRGFDLHCGIGDLDKFQQRDHVLLSAAGVKFLAPNPFLAQPFHQAPQIVNVERVAKLPSALGQLGRLALHRRPHQGEHPVARRMIVVGVTSRQANDVAVGMGFGNKLGHDLGLAVEIKRSIGRVLTHQELAAIAVLGFDDVLAFIDRPQHLPRGHLYPCNLASFQNLGQMPSAADIDHVGRLPVAEGRRLAVGHHGEIDHHLNLLPREVGRVHFERILLPIPSKNLVPPARYAKRPRPR